MPGVVVFDIMPKLFGAGLGEIHAIITAQPARLSLENRSVLHKAPLIVNEWACALRVSIASKQKAPVNARQGSWGLV